MFGSKNKAQNLKLEQFLHQMGSKLPETNWILLLDKKGVQKLHSQILLMMLIVRWRCQLPSMH